MSALKVYPQLRRRRPESGALTTLEASRNCGPAGGAGLANWALGHVSGDPDFVTHHAFRLAAGDPRGSDGKPRGLSSAEILAGLKALGVTTATRHWGESTAQIPPALETGAALGLCVDYGTITDLAPWLSGQPTFRSGHFLDVYSWRWADPDNSGVDTVVDHDPLFDGRTRPTYTAPRGPQVGPWPVFVQALGRFRVGGKTYATGAPIGAGRGVFIIVRPS
jgi:hypothetical protein